MDPLDDMEDPGFDEPEAEIDALTLLREDHQEVLALIESFERASGDDRRQELAQRICELLTAHAQIEEEIFYPAVRAAILEQDLLDDAEVEHAVTKGLVEEIRSMDVGEALYDAKAAGRNRIATNAEEASASMSSSVRASGTSRSIPITP